MRARPDVAEGGGVVVGGDDSHRLFGCDVWSVRRVREAVLSPGLASAYHLDGLIGGVSEWERKDEVDNDLGEQLCQFGGREGLRGSVMMSFARLLKLKLGSWAVSKGCRPLKLSTGRLPSSFA